MTQLRIGDVAAVLGISTKTIRYYHHAGVLPEPPRAANGYRVYGAHDLIALQRIRRLQTLGLPLKQIRTLLRSPSGTDDLHAVLHTLLGNVDDEIAVLQQRRTRIVAALAVDAPAVAGPSPTFAAIQAQLAPYLTDQQAALLEGEQPLWALFDAAQPPDQSQTTAQALAAQLAAHPTQTQALLRWSERLATFSATTPDDPALEQLAREFVQSDAFRWLNDTFGTQEQDSSPDALWSALVVDALTPAQQRFFELVQQFAQQLPKEAHDVPTHV